MGMNKDIATLSKLNAAIDRLGYDKFKRRVKIALIVSPALFVMGGLVFIFKRDLFYIFKSFGLSQAAAGTTIQMLLMICLALGLGLFFGAFRFHRLLKSIEKEKLNESK